MTSALLITGGGGYIGSALTASLAADPGDLKTIVSADIRHPTAPLDGIRYVVSDVRDPSLAELLTEHKIEVVVHLAAIVSPGRRPDRALERSIDVDGTENVLEACLAAGVKKIIISSSGAAYGYHEDNPEWIDENDALRGNPEFAYSDHKRLVEELLARWRVEHPELQQLVFRSGTVLGRSTQNQITDLFDRRFVLGVAGSQTPFVFIWDEDVVLALRRGIFTDTAGIFNLAADGSISLAEIARRMNKRSIISPAWLIRCCLRILRAAGASQYGPEQVNFLQYRPVLSNRRLKEEFGYTPRKSTAEVFDLFWEARENSHESKKKRTGLRR